MKPILRWNLILGCAVVAALELPHDARVLAQDLRGPWGTSASPGAVEPRSWESAAHDHELDVTGADTPAWSTETEVGDARLGDSDG